MNHTLQKTILLSLIFTCLCALQASGQHSGYLTRDGAWCWFSDPRAVVIDGQIVTGWVTENGSVEAARFDLSDQTTETSELYFALQKDDHNNPAFSTTASGEVIAMYTRHSVKDLFINRLKVDQDPFRATGAQLIHPIAASELKQFPRETMTYANPYRLAGEDDRIYCFGRWTGFKPNITWSDDGGMTWSKSRVMITNYPFDANNRPYVKYYSDGGSRIHMVFTDGHPRVEPTNSVYYAYYEKGAFFRASGEQICTVDELPFAPEDASVVYTSNPEEGRAWIADIGEDEDNNPVILYTRSPEESNHEYWYARYSTKGWNEYKICDSGPWFPQTSAGTREREPHYFGGLTIHPDQASVVYLSRQIEGVFEIERWQTSDGGQSWHAEPITQDSEYDNVRPYVPRGLKKEAQEVVLWMENQKYIHYTDFKTSVKYYIRK